MSGKRPLKPRASCEQNRAGRAADAIAQLARGDELVPDPLDKTVHERIAEAVRVAAVEPMMVFS
jgi:malic enzyme